MSDKDTCDGKPIELGKVYFTEINGNIARITPLPRFSSQEIIVPDFASETTGWAVNVIVPSGEKHTIQCRRIYSTQTAIYRKKIADLEAYTETLGGK